MTWLYRRLIPDRIYPTHFDAIMLEVWTRIHIVEWQIEERTRQMEIRYLQRRIGV